MNYELWGHDIKILVAIHGVFSDRANTKQATYKDLPYHILIHHRYEKRRFTLGSDVFINRFKLRPLSSIIEYCVPEIGRENNNFVSCP